MEELLQKINRIFDEHKLLGDYNFTEDEYSLMLENVSILCYNLLYYSTEFEEKTHKLIFTILVEIAKRWKDSDNEDNVEENNRFWDNISKCLVNEDNINQRLYHAFTNIISQLGKQQIVPTVLTGKRYYSTLMMHSFAPKNSIFSFFDLCYNIFKKDLNFGFTSDDEWLCEIVATQLKIVLSGGYRENKKVSIGSSAYSIKIGLRSFAVNEDLSDDFVEFIKNIFYQINKLFNRERINENTRLKRYIVEWWKNKTDSGKVTDDTNRKKRVSTVSKQDIVAKYIRDENVVFLYIPSIRLDDSNSRMWLSIHVNGKKIQFGEMITKRGELVITTKQIELELNDVLESYDTINIRVKILENQVVIFDSENSISTSLNREFILFESEKEILCQINKPANYFVYSKNIDALKSIPDELNTYGINFYNIYPKVGESLAGETKQFLFIDQSKTVNLGKTTCLIGSLLDVEWIFDDISCVVYTDNVKLMIPRDTNLRALELRIDKKTYNFQKIECEQIGSNYFQFGLNALGLIFECYPTVISLYSYEKEITILSETIIMFPNLDIKFNNPFYYGDIERKLTVSNCNETHKFTWSKLEYEIKCPLNDGLLLIKVAYLRWRTGNNKWHNDPINNILWHKDFLENGDLLEIEMPIEDANITLLGKAKGKSFEIAKNHSEKYEVGRSIYTNEGETAILAKYMTKIDKYLYH